MTLMQDLSQLKVLMMKWGISGKRLQAFYIAICVVMVLILLLFYNVVYNQNSLKKKMDIQTAFYCNNLGAIDGKEGRLPFIKNPSRNYKLVQVQMVVRHGDRAPIVLDTLPNTGPVHISCIFNKSWTRYDDLDKMRRVSSMFEMHGNPKRTIIQEREVCVGGQLTPTGFLQHISNGKHLNKVYLEFLNEIKKSLEVLVMTTDYSRTVQSAAALLYGMFGDEIPQQKLKIHVQHDKYPETHFLRDGNGETINCPVLIRRLRDIWQIKSLIKLRGAINPIKSEFARLFDTERSSIPSLDRLVDDLYTRICHGKSLPRGPNGKVSYDLASRSFQLSHKLITLKHTPLAELQTLSIISQMAQHAGGLVDEESANKRKLVIYSGHDTVLVPLLATWGVHDGKWPPYASRVVFELWRRSPSSSEHEDSEALYSKFKGYFFRLLYNGRPLTREVKFCRNKLVDVELCPLKELVRYVSTDEFNGKNFFHRIKNICAVS